MKMVVLSLAIFLSAVGLDFADTSNTRAVAEGRAHAAARWSVAMYALGCIGFFSVIKIAWWLVFPEAAGLYAGSVWAMKRLDRTTRDPHTNKGGET